MMDLIVLKKRLSTFRTEGGQVRGVSNEVLMDILKTWEAWTGKPRELYEGLGVCRQSFSNMIKKAKQLARENATSEFKEVNIESILGQTPGTIVAIEVTWDSGKVIRFPSVDQLVDFLKKVA
jgi:hypothetical protein